MHGRESQNANWERDPLFNSMDQRLVNAPISTAAESRRSDESSLLARRALAVREWRTNNSSRRMAATQSPKPTYWSKDGTKSEPFRELGGTLMAVCASNALGPFNAASSARAWVEGWYTTGCASTSNTGVCWLKTGCQKVSNRAGLLRHNNLGARTAAASNGTAAAASHRRRRPASHRPLRSGTAGCGSVGFGTATAPAV